MSKDKDVNVTAADTVAQATHDAAVALGRRGGLKGGKARAAALSPDARASIASEAANVRWDQERRTRAKAEIVAALDRLWCDEDRLALLGEILTEMDADTDTKAGE